MQQDIIHSSVAQQSSDLEHATPQQSSNYTATRVANQSSSQAGFLKVAFDETDDAFSLATPSRSLLTPTQAVKGGKHDHENVEMDQDATQVLPHQGSFDQVKAPWSSLCTPPTEPVSPQSAMPMSEDEREALSWPGPSHYPEPASTAPVSSAPTALVEPNRKRERSRSSIIDEEAQSPMPPPAFSPSLPPQQLLSSQASSSHAEAAPPPATLRFSSPALEEEEPDYPASGLAPPSAPRSRSTTASPMQATAPTLSPMASLSPVAAAAAVADSPSPSPMAAPPAAVDVDMQASDAVAAAQVAAMPPSPPRRNLRARKPDQLNPYTIEGMRYRLRLERNDWQDAVVSQREVLRRSKAEREEERKRQRRERGQPSDESSDEESRAQREKERTQRRAAREQQRLEREEARKRRRETEALQQAQAAEKLRAAPDASALFALYGGELTDSQEDNEASPPPSPNARARDVSKTYARRSRRSLTTYNNIDKGDAAPSSSSSSDTGPVRKRFRRAKESGSDANNEGRQAAHSVVSISSDEHSTSSSAPRARQRWHSRRSSSRPVPPLDDDGDETYYAQQFKLLRRVMPFHMARKHIEDLKAMHRGKAYHSDGHVSATPEPSEHEGSASDNETRVANTSLQRSTPATTPQTSPLRLAPGEARRRSAPRTQGDEARFEIIGDPLSEEDEAPSPVTPSDSSDEENRGVSVDADIRWWAAPLDRGRPFESRRRRAVDDIDRLLQRAGTSAGKVVRKCAKDSSNKRTSGAGGRRKSTSGALAQRQSTSGTAQSRQASTSAWRGPEAARNAQKHRAPVSRAATSRRAGKPNRLANPPVVVPRMLKLLDLIDDRVLFDFELPQDLRTLDGANVPDAASTRGSVVQTPGAHSSTTMHTPGPGHSSGLRSSINETPTRTGAASIQAINLRSPSPPVVRPPAPQLQQARLQAQAQANARQPLSPLLPQRTYQARIDSLLPGKAPVAAAIGLPEHLHVQQLEAQEWSDFGSLTLDFGIAPLPAGICFEGNSYLGRGRLFELLNLARHDALACEPRDTQLLGVGMRTDWSAHRLMEELPAIFDAIFAAVQMAVKEESRGTAVDDTLRFLCLSLSSVRKLLGTYEATRLQRRITVELARVHTRLAAVGIWLANASPGVGTLLLSLHWFKVELCWRSIGGVQHEEAPPSTGFASINGEADENLCHASRELMLALLVHGLHRTMKSVKVAARSDDEGPGVTIIRDLSAELWICLIHLLSHTTTTAHFGPQAAFWPSFEASYAHFQQLVPARRALLVSETVWYATLSMCALSQFSAATGTVTSKPHLQQYWALVLRALSAIRLRYDDQIERAMPSAAISKRDHYMRAVVQRCLNLASIWHWSFDGADALLSKLFHLFESHRLANLPCEQDHDFAPFLREYDESLLYEASKRRESTAFHVFVKLLAQASAEFRSSAAEGKEGDKRVSRLLSRMMPMRVMPFSRAAPPTALERSMLFNHYSLAMLFLHLVPSAAAQRLRQLKSFLVFQGADVASQITCIRAMVYAAVIYRQHNLDVTPIVSWFSGAFKSLLQEFAQLEAQSSRPAAKDKVHHAAHQASLRQQRRVASLLVAALRSVQHIIEHKGLGKSVPNETPSYPNVALLDKAWTSEILETQLAVDPSVGHEALKIIHAFLIQRNEAVAALLPRRAAETTGARAVIDEDSQDSFAEFDDDLDAVFAAVDAAEAAQQRPHNAVAAAPDEASASESASIHAKDRAFAEVARTTIVPSLFRLISNIFHPDHASTGRNVSLSMRTEPLEAGAGRDKHRAHLDEVLKRASRRCYVELLIDCWAGCANVLVRNGLRDWDSFLTLGNESWKRLDDAIAKRDVGLRFLQNMILLDTTSYESNASELLSMWFSSAPARALSIQHIYTRTLSDLEPWHPWFRECPWPRDESGKLHAISLEAFEQHRLVAIQSILPAMRQDYETVNRTPGAVRRRQATFACLSALLSSLRIYAEESGVQQASRKAEQIEYLDFASSICAAMRADLGDTILRGVDAELRRTSLLIERLHAAAAVVDIPPQLVDFS